MSFIVFDRANKTSSKEVREGTSYASGCNFDQSAANDIVDIPAPTKIPQYAPLDRHQLENAREIFFDLETTGLGMYKSS